MSGTVTALSPLLAEGRGAATTQAELPAVSREVEDRAASGFSLDNPPVTRYT